MTISILFGQRKQRYDGEYGPEVLVAWDEFSIEENPEGFEDKVSRIKKNLENEMEAFRVINIEVDQDKILRLLNNIPKVTGMIVAS